MISGGSSGGSSITVDGSPVPSLAISSTPVAAAGVGALALPPSYAAPLAAPVQLANGSQLWTPPAQVIDSMTGTAGADLATHVGELGANPWANNSVASGFLALTAGGRVRNNGTTQAVYFPSGAPLAADYWIEADAFIASLPAGDSMGIGLRGLYTSTTVAKGYVLRYAVTSAQWQLALFNGAVWTTAPAVIGTPFASTPTVGSTVHLALQAKGTQITAYIQGVSRITVSDATLATAGSGMIFHTGGSANTDSTGIHITNVVVHA
jgi:hypothetical protein